MTQIVPIDEHLPPSSFAGAIQAATAGEGCAAARPAATTGTTAGAKGSTTTATTSRPSSPSTTATNRTA